MLSFVSRNLACKTFSLRNASTKSPIDTFLHWTKDQNIFNPRMSLSYDRNGLRGLKSLEEIPKGAVVAVVPLYATFSLAQYQNNLVSDNIFADLPQQFGELAAHLQIALLLFQESLYEQSHFAPWINILPTWRECNNVVYLTEASIRSQLKDRVPENALRGFVLTVNAIQKYITNAVSKNPYLSGIFSTYEKAGHTRAALHERFMWAVAMAYSRSFMQKDFDPSEKDDFARITPSHIPKNQSKKVEDPTKISMLQDLNKAESNDTTTEDLSFIPLLDLINYPDQYSVPNVTYETMSMSALASADAKMMQSTFGAAGMTESQMEKIGDSFILISSVDHIEKGDIFYMDYMNYYDRKKQETMLEILLAYGFVPK